jgi:hypothetical protein
MLCEHALEQSDPALLKANYILLLHAFEPAKMPLTPSLAAAAEAGLLASVFRPLAADF